MKALLGLLVLEAVAIAAAFEFNRTAEELMLIAGAVAAIAYLWRRVVRPTIAAINRASHVYELLATEESGFLARLHKLEGGLAALGKTVDELLSQSKRLDRMERVVDEIRRAVGTREGDPPRRPSG